MQQSVVSVDFFELPIHTSSPEHSSPPYSEQDFRFSFVQHVSDSDGQK